MRRITVLCILIMLCLAAVPAIAETVRYDIPLEGSPSKGPQNAKVVIVEFLDYQ